MQNYEQINQKNKDMIYKKERKDRKVNPYLTEIVCVLLSARYL